MDTKTKSSKQSQSQKKTYQEWSKPANKLYSITLLGQGLSCLLVSNSQWNYLHIDLIYAPSVSIVSALFSLFSEIVMNKIFMDISMRQLITRHFKRSTEETTFQGVNHRDNISKCWLWRRHFKVPTKDMTFQSVDCGDDISRCRPSR